MYFIVYTHAMVLSFHEVIASVDNYILICKVQLLAIMIELGRIININRSASLTPELGQSGDKAITLEKLPFIQASVLFLLNSGMVDELVLLDNAQVRLNGTGHCCGGGGLVLELGETGLLAGQLLCGLQKEAEVPRKKENKGAFFKIRRTAP